MFLVRYQSNLESCYFVGPCKHLQLIRHDCLSACHAKGNFQSAIIIIRHVANICIGMTSETEREGNIPNPFLNLIGLWQNYLIYWIEVNRNFYENAIKTNELWFKLWDPLLKVGKPERKDTTKVE
jgi:hypothetical protein